VPEVDQLDALRQTNDDNVVVTIRGIGEMSSQNPGSKITLSANSDIFGLRASVQISRTARDEAIWNAMDDAADDVAKVFANGQQYEVFHPPQGPPAQIFKLQPTELASSKLPFAKRRDRMGTTHHE